jgi:hypothetical protein
MPIEFKDYYQIFGVPRDVRKPKRPGEPPSLAAAGISKAISWLRMKRC